MRVLTVNSGSSSVKCALFQDSSIRNDPKKANFQRILTADVRQIGSHSTLRYHRLDGIVHEEGDSHIPTHELAVQRLLQLVDNYEVEAVGHRIVHGGPWFQEPVVIDDGLLSRFDQLAQLAPLHNPACLAGIRETQSILGRQVPMVAVFDTAFHRNLPAHAYTYAIPHDLTERYHIRRYGFHGLAHGSSADLYARAVDRPVDQVNLITLHLGSGCSAAAIRHGRSVDTSMGFTPLEGLVMGTRCGDIDPALVTFLARQAGWSGDEVERVLNQQSGLVGLSGLSSDMAVLLRAEQAGHEQASLAIEVFCYRVRKYVGAYLAALERTDAVIFSGGIGEHAPIIRKRICRGMEWCGLMVDDGANESLTSMPAGTIGPISPSGARIGVFVAAVDEETVIARETLACLTP